jgi:outer membrane protein OmpA-like peptidoglycan-associated protein
MQSRRIRSSAVLAAIIVVALSWSSRAYADEHIRGVIDARGTDGTVSLKLDDATSVTVVVKDYTKVRRTDGIRQIKTTSSSLIPGLRIKVDGEYEGATRFVAQRIEFSRSDLKTARDIQGGIDPTDRRSLDNQRRIGENARRIEQQQQTLAQQADQIASNRDRIKANDEKIVATAGAVNARITDLSNYKVISTVTVYFRNGKAMVEPKYKTQLQQLAAQTKDVRGYAVQIEGYASAVGSQALNQKLSMQRADAVAAVLQQNGVPLTSVVVPAAMGTTGQVATNKTAKGQAENRRTVVTLLQNKGISER